MLLENVKAAVSKEEWDVRVELATAYRACYYLGYEKSTFGHLSARVPGEPDSMLLNPFGLGFDEVTASNLVKVNSKKEILLYNGYSLNEAAWNIHSGIMFNQSSINAIMHLHTLDGVAVSTQKNGFLPLCQDGVLFYDKIAYHNFEGIVINPDEAPRLLKDLGDKNVLMLRNHGNIYVGSTIAETFFYMFFFEKACSIQIRALSGEVSPISKEIVSSIPGERDIVLNSMHTADNKPNIELSYHLIFDMWKRRMKRLYPEVES